MFGIPNIGRAAVDLLNAAPATRSTEGEPIVGASPPSYLLRLVAFDGARPTTTGLTTMGLNRTLLQAQQARDVFLSAQSSTPGKVDDALLLELLLVADTMIFASEFGSELLSAQERTGNALCNVLEIDSIDRRIQH